MALRWDPDIGHSKTDIQASKEAATKNKPMGMHRGALGMP